VNCRLGAADYGGLGMLNVKMTQTGLRGFILFWWKMRVEERRHTQRRPAGIVSEEIWSFGLSCEDAHDRDQWRLRIKGEPANPGLPGKLPLKWFVCPYVVVVVIELSYWAASAKKWFERYSQKPNKFFLKNIKGVMLWAADVCSGTAFAQPGPVSLISLGRFFSVRVRRG